METLITVVLTLSVTLNVLIIGTFGLAFGQWKKRQKSKDNIEELFKGWAGTDKS